MRNPCGRLRAWCSAWFKALDFVEILHKLNDRMASLCLSLHFLVFLALPIPLMVYVSDRMLGGNSTPERDGGEVVIRMPEAVWRGFFWFSNFYGSLSGVVVTIFILYILWDRGFRAEPYLKSFVKACLAVVVAMGFPLKFVVERMMIMPVEDKVDVRILEFIDLTEVAFAPYMSVHGPWFLTKFVVICPILFLLLTLVRWRRDQLSRRPDNGSA